MRDPTATPWWVVVVLFLLPVGVLAFVGAIAFRRMAPLIFRCRCCHRDFQRAAYRGFPAACPLCGARDWNA
jgi:Zn finger protein HypA/HybF involved in hydrogenase expression